MRQSTTLCTSISFTLLFTASVEGAEPNLSPDLEQPVADDGYSWGLGLAALSQQQMYKDIDRDNFAIPVLFFENRWVELMGPWLDFKLPSIRWQNEQELTFSLRTQLFGFDGYEEDDAPILEGMDEREAGIFAGPSFSWYSPAFSVFGEWQLDVSGNSKGQRATLDIERQFHIRDRFIFTPAV